MPLLWHYCEKYNSKLKKVDEADISSLPHQPTRNAFGILWAGLTALAGNMPSHIQEPKNRNLEMLCLIRMVIVFKHTEVATHACSVIFVHL